MMPHSATTEKTSSSAEETKRGVHEQNKPHRVEHTTTGNEVKRLETPQTHRVRRSLTPRTTQTRFKTALFKPVHNQRQ